MTISETIKDMGKGKVKVIITTAANEIIQGEASWIYLTT
jgi:hypothetical protein